MGLFSDIWSQLSVESVFEELDQTAETGWRTESDGRILYRCGHLWYAIASCPEYGDHNCVLVFSQGVLVLDTFGGFRAGSRHLSETRI
jgi:hypothetical protein